MAASAFTPWLPLLAQVAAVIAGVIERPVAEVFTNPASADLMREYYKDIGAFEARGR